MTLNPTNPLHLALAGISYIFVIVITASYASPHTRKEKFRLTLALSLGLASIIFILPIAEEWKLTKIRNPASILQQTVIFYFIAEYLLISFSAVFFVGYKKGGLDKLKGLKSPGLYNALLAGLMGGLVMGSVLGAIIGQLSKEATAGIVIGSAVGLTLGLLYELIFGLRSEYEKVEPEKVIAWPDYYA